MRILLFILSLTACFLSNGQTVINSYRFGGGSPPPTPTLPTTWAYYEANDGSTITTSGGFVTQWRDKQGGGRHIAPDATLGGTGPVWDGSTKINFGSGQNLFRNTAPSSPYTMYFVVRVPSLVNSGVFLYRDLGVFSGTAQHFLSVDQPTGNLLLSCDGNVAQLTRVMTLGSYVVLRGYFNPAASSQLQINNATQASGNAGASAQGGTIYFGLEFPGVTVDAFDLKGAYIFPNQPNDNDVKAYLTYTWGVP